MQKPMPMPDSMSGMKPRAGAATPAAAYAGGDAAPQAAREGEPASPQEQAAYESVVNNAARVIHDEKFSDTMAQQMKGAEDPASVMGQAVATVMMRVLGEAQKQRAQVPPEVIIPATQEAYELVFEIADRIGAASGEGVMERGWLEAVDATRVALVSAGIVSQEQAQADMGEMQAMDGGAGPAGPAKGGFAGMMGAA